LKNLVNKRNIGYIFARQRNSDHLFANNPFIRKHPTNKLLCTKETRWLPQDALHKRLVYSLSPSINGGILT